MRRVIPFAAAGGLVLLACCSTPRPAPPPRVTVVPPPPAYVPRPQPTAADWRDWPLTPGDWRYAAGGGATFGAGGGPTLLTLACDAPRRTVRMTLAGEGASAPVTVRTTSTVRAVPLDAAASATLAGQDPLLDAIAFSRGRFVVEQAGHAPLVVPVYAEIGRVIEDCRG